MTSEMIGIAPIPVETVTMRYINYKCTKLFSSFHYGHFAKTHINSSGRQDLIGDVKSLNGPLGGNITYDRSQEIDENNEPHGETAETAKLR